MTHQILVFEFHPDCELTLIAPRLTPALWVRLVPELLKRLVAPFPRYRVQLALLFQSGIAEIRLAELASDCILRGYRTVQAEKGHT
jgi:hypothetical protein